MPSVLLQIRQYLTDVRTAIAQASIYFDSQDSINRTQVVVFDIDETALSNLPVRVAMTACDVRRLCSA